MPVFEVMVLKHWNHLGHRTDTKAQIRLVYQNVIS